jgi:hypothetical protein
MGRKWTLYIVALSYHSIRVSVWEENGLCILSHVTYHSTRVSVWEENGLEFEPVLVGVTVKFPYNSL